MRALCITRGMLSIVAKRNYFPTGNRVGAAKSYAYLLHKRSRASNFIQLQSMNKTGYFSIYNVMEHSADPVHLLVDLCTQHLLANASVLTNASIATPLLLRQILHACLHALDIETWDNLKKEKISQDAVSFPFRTLERCVRISVLVVGNLYKYGRIRITWRH